VADGRWVLLSYRVPREPSAPRIAVWRKLKRLGVAQLSDGLVALPADARTREHLEWIAQEVREAGGQAGVWLAEPTEPTQERELATEMAAARAGEYTAVTVEAEQAAALPAAQRRRTGCCATLKITTGAAFTMPTTIPANRTAGSVKCRPSSAGRRERPVVALHNGPRALRVGVRETGAICGSPGPGADISHGAESLSVGYDHGRWRPGRYTHLPMSVRHGRGPGAVPGW